MHAAIALLTHVVWNTLVQPQHWQQSIWKLKMRDRDGWWILGWPRRGGGHNWKLHNNPAVRQPCDSGVYPCNSAAQMLSGSPSLSISLHPPFLHLTFLLQNCEVVASLCDVVHIVNYEVYMLIYALDVAFSPDELTGTFMTVVSQT